MSSVSYIVKGVGITKNDLETLRSFALNADSHGDTVEYILYFDELPNLTADSPISFVASNVASVSSFQKAIATSSGDRLVFTTLANVLSDESGSLTQQAGEDRSGHLAVPVSNSSKLNRLSGVRLIRNVRYVIASKGFANAHITKPDQLGSAIRLADKLLSLEFIGNTTSHLPDILIKSTTFNRPYKQMARRAFLIARQKIRDERKRRRDEKLSRRVPPVPYSPDIPVFIICRDRVEPLKKLVNWLEKEGLHNIYFIDNASTYPPLLDYFKKSPYEVIRLLANIGHTSPWVCGAIEIYAKNQPFIVTDPDVLPDKNSHGAVKVFCELLTKYPERRKVGFGLKIDDLPDHYELKQHVISWEKQFWVTQKEPDVYDAEIDTTFAVYRQNTPYVLGPALRTGGRFVARHEPWYIDSKHPTEEVKYYRSHADKVVGSWGIGMNEASENYVANLYKNGEDVNATAN